MKVGFFVNSIVAGMVVLCVWIYDFHYLRRLGQKLSSAVVEEYQTLAKSLTSRPEYRFPQGLSLDDFYYVAQDTIYVELFNFQNPNGTMGLNIAQLFTKAYANRLAGVHRVRVYLRHRRLKRDQELPMDEPSVFQDSHLETQKFYYLRIMNSDPNDEISVKDNVVGVTTSPEKLGNLDYLEGLVGKAIYHFKRLTKLRDIRFDTILGSDATLIEKLKATYLITQAEELARHADALAYINQNKNLVFLENYKIELKNEGRELAKNFEEKNLLEISKKLAKKDLSIYTTVYMFEEY